MDSCIVVVCDMSVIQLGRSTSAVLRAIVVQIPFEISAGVADYVKEKADYSVKGCSINYRIGKLYFNFYTVLSHSLLHLYLQILEP